MPAPSPKLDRILAYTTAALTLTLSTLLHHHQRLLGFPDGFLTDLDRAQKPLFTLFITLNISIALWLIFFGSIAPRQNIRKKLSLTLIIHGLIALLFLLTNLYLTQHLRNSNIG
jgi:hypothetical protein